MWSRQPHRQGATGTCSVSQVSAGRRNGRVDRNRRRSFNIPIVRAKFTLLAFAAGFVARLLFGTVGRKLVHTSCNQRRNCSNNFEITSRVEILQWSASE